MAANGQRRASGGDQRSDKSTDTLSLGQLGVDAKESERFQQSAAAPRERVDEVLKTADLVEVPE